jgi:uncharacterized protein YbaP (TraB family)
MVPPLDRRKKPIAMKRSPAARYLVPLLLAGLWLGPGVAAEVFAGQGTGVGQGSENALLWRIDGPAPQSSYLFGTMHSADPRVTQLPPTVAEAFRASDSVVLELVPDAGTLAEAVQLMCCGNDVRISDLLGPEEYAQVAEAMALRGIGAEALDRMRPWAVAVTLATPPNEGQDVLDTRLYRAAKALDKPVHGLESPAEQLAIFSTLGADEERQLLRSVLDQLDEMQTMLDVLHEAYLARDLNRIAALSEEWVAEEDAALWEALMAELVDSRNRRMAERLQPLLAEGGLFVAVGALHLPGESGLIRLLRARGYRLEPLH